MERQRRPVSSPKMDNLKLLSAVGIDSTEELTSSLERVTFPTVTKFVIEAVSRVQIMVEIGNALESKSNLKLRK